MIGYIENTERIINEIKKIENVERVKLKDLILELAEHLAKGILDQRPEVIAKLKTILATDTQRPRGQDRIDISMVSMLIKKIKNQNFPSVSLSWIDKSLPEQYKEHREYRIVEPNFILTENITDANLLQIAPELKKRLRKIENLGPEKETKIDNEPIALEEHDWKCPMAEELSKLAIKCENLHDHEHDKEFCKNTAKIIRIARDKRFATTFSRYQAIVISAESSRSLADLAGDEVEVLNRWEVHDNERTCRECIDLINCRATKCNHVCHQFKKEMTTKGIKWAVRETQELATLKNRFSKLNSNFSDDLCDMMKIVFTNDHLKMTQGTKKDLMAKHIKRDDCDQCMMFTKDHPNFFKEHLQ